MAARAAEPEFETARAGTADGDARHAHAVDGYETVDIRMVAEDRFHAAQVAASFLADIAREHDVGAGFDSAFFKHLDYREQYRQTAGIVTDARCVVSSVPELHGGVHLWRKHRIEMGADQQHGSVAASPANADGVSFAVDIGVVQSARPKLFEVVRRAFVFHERRRGDFGDANLFFDIRRFAQAKLFEGFDHPRVGAYGFESFTQRGIDGNQRLPDLGLDHARP